MLGVLLAEVEWYGRMPAAEARCCRRFRAEGVPYRPAAWLGRPLPVAERMALSRTAESLFRRDLAMATFEPHRCRVVALRPTATGLRRALGDYGTKSDLPAVRNGLLRAAWGAELLRDQGVAADFGEAAATTPNVAENLADPERFDWSALLVPLQSTPSIPSAPGHDAA